MRRVTITLATLAALTGCGGATPLDAAAIPVGTGRGATSIKPPPSIVAPSAISASDATRSSYEAEASMPARSVYDALPDFNGLGPLRFGMDAQQMRKAWTQPLYGAAPANDPNARYYLRPRKDDYNVLLMMDGGKFVRVDVRKDSVTAPGGGRVGIAVDALRKLYVDGISASPNKYDPMVQTLRVVPPHGGSARLVFKTNAPGKVTSWRIGLPLQVDYVEGCS